MLRQRGRTLPVVKGDRLGAVPCLCFGEHNDHALGSDINVSIDTNTINYHLILSFGNLYNYYKDLLNTRLLKGIN